MNRLPFAVAILLASLIAVSPLVAQPNTRPDAGADDGRERGEGREQRDDPTVTPVLVRTLRAHSRGVQSVAISADGMWLLTGSADRTAKLWQIGDFGPGAPVEVASVEQPLGISHVAISPDGAFAATIALEVGAETSRTVAAVWHLAETESGRAFRQIAPLFDERAVVNDAAFSPDGRFLIAGTLAGKARIWRLGAGMGADSPTAEAIADVDAGQVITAVAITENAEWAVVGTRADGEALGAQIWHIPAGNGPRPAAKKLDAGGVAHISQVAIAESLGQNWVMLRSFEESAIEFWPLTIRGSQAGMGTGMRHATDCADAAVGPYLLTAMAERVDVLMLELSEPPTLGSIASIPHARTTAVAIAPDATWAATAGVDRTVKIWRLLGEPERQLEPAAKAFIDAVKSADAAQFWELLAPKGRLQMAAQLDELKAIVARLPEAARARISAGWAPADRNIDVADLDALGFAGVFLRSTDGRAWAKRLGADGADLRVTVAGDGVGATARVAIAGTAQLVFAEQTEQGWRFVLHP